MTAVTVVSWWPVFCLCTKQKTRSARSIVKGPSRALYSMDLYVLCTKRCTSRPPTISGPPNPVSSSASASSRGGGDCRHAIGHVVVFGRTCWTRPSPSSGESKSSSSSTRARRLRGPRSSDSGRLSGGKKSGLGNPKALHKPWPFSAREGPGATCNATSGATARPSRRWGPSANARGHRGIGEPQPKWLRLRERGLYLVVWL